MRFSFGKNTNIFFEKIDHWIFIPNTCYYSSFYNRNTIYNYRFKIHKDIYPYTYFPIQYSQKNPLLVSYFIFKRMLQSRKHSIPYKISIKSSSILLIKYKSEAIYISHKILIRNNNFILFPNTLFRLITFCQIIPRNTSSIYKLITRFKKLSKIIISWHINLQN